MNKYNSIALSILILISGLGCKKVTLDPIPAASINIVNAISGGPIVKLGNVANDSVSYANIYKPFGLAVGTSLISVYQNNDLSKVFFNRTETIKAGELYSLFLTGQFPTVDTIFVKENLKAINDSVTGVRFINLSPNSGKINVTISATPSINEFSSIDYKQYSDFKMYPASAANTSYAFQIRSATTNVVLLSYTFTVGRFKYVTLVFRGINSGTPALSVGRVNHY